MRTPWFAPANHFLPSAFSLLPWPGVGAEAFEALALLGDVPLGQAIGDPEGRAQVVIVPGEVIFLQEQVFGGIRRDAGYNRRDACAPRDQGCGQAIDEVTAERGLLLRGGEVEEPVVLRLAGFGDVAVGTLLRSGAKEEG